MDPFAAADPPKPDRHLNGVLEQKTEAEDLVRHFEDEPQKAHHGEADAPERNVVDQEGGAHVTAAAQHTNDHRGGKPVERHGSRIGEDHDRAQGGCRNRELEKRQHIGTQNGEKEHTLQRAKQDAEAKGCETQGISNAWNAAVSGADLLSDDDRSSIGNAKDAGSGELIDVAGDSIGSDEVTAGCHVAHDDSDQRIADAPERFVCKHRRTVAHKTVEHITAGTEKRGKLQRYRAAAKGIAKGEQKLHHAREKGRRGGTCDAEGRKAELAENEDIIADCVEEHGRTEDQHAKARIFDAALHPNVDGGKGVENIGKANDTDVWRAEFNEEQVVCYEQEDLRGKEKEKNGKHC